MCNNYLDKIFQINQTGFWEIWKIKLDLNRTKNDKKEMGYQGIDSEPHLKCQMSGIEFG